MVFWGSHKSIGLAIMVVVMEKMTSSHLANPLWEGSNHMLGDLVIL